MILKNPTDNTVTIQIKGIPLSVAPQGTVEVSEEQGQAWLMTHEFLREVDTVVKTEVPAEKPKVEAPKAAPKVEAPAALTSVSNAPASAAAVIPKK